MSIEEKISVERSKLGKMIEDNNGNLLYELIQRQSRKVDKLIVKYFRYSLKIETEVNYHIFKNT